MEQGGTTMTKVIWWREQVSCRRRAWRRAENRIKIRDQRDGERVAIASQKGRFIEAWSRKVKDLADNTARVLNTKGNNR